MALVKLNATLGLTGSLPAGLGGKVLQVVQATKTNTFESTSTSFVDITDYNVAITPSSSSNKILIQGFLTVSGNTWSTTGLYFQLVRGSTNILMEHLFGRMRLVLKVEVKKVFHHVIFLF